MKISNEIKVGVFVVVSLTILIVGYKYLKGQNLLIRNNRYFAVYERIDGLIESNPVILYGHRVGMIEDIEWVPDSDNQLIVKFSVDDDIKIPKGSMAKVVNTDLLGGKALKLEFSDSKTYIKNWDTMLGGNELSIQQSVTEILSPLSNKVNNLVSTLNNIIEELDTFLNKDGGKRDLGTLSDLQKSIKNIEQLTGTLNQFISSETGRLHNILTYAENITRTISENRSQLDNFIDGISSISDSLQASNIKGTIGEANKALKNFNSILEKINNGEGSVGMLIYNDTLYNNLQSASDNLDKLVIDLKENPRRYVHFSLFGGKDKNKKKK